MATSSGLIIVTTAGLVPPKQYLQMAYAKFPTYGGSLVRLDTPELVIAGDAALPPLDDLMKDLENNKDIVSILYFAHSKTPLTKESEQPFDIIVDDKGQRILCGFIEGEYPTKMHADAEHTDEFYVLDDVLGPHLRKIYTKMCGGDLDKFEEELLDPDTEKLINSLSANRGVMVLQSLSGNVFKFEKGNDLGHEFPWGWVSNKLGFEEKSSKDYQPMTPPEPEKEEVVPPKRTLGNRFGTKKTTVPAIANVEPVSTTIAKENAKTDTALPDNAGRPKISCPEPIRQKGKNDYMGWYKKWTIDIGLTKDQMKNGAEAPANDEWMAKNVGKFGKIADKTEEMRAKIEASKAKLREPPLIQPQTRKIINDLLDSGAIKAKLESGRILSADELKEAPKVAPWSAQFGRDLMEVYRWDREIIGEFIEKCEVNKDRLGTVLLIEELIRENLKLMLSEEPKTGTKETPKVTETPATETKETSETPADPPPVVKKTSANRFATRKAA